MFEVTVIEKFKTNEGLPIEAKRLWQELDTVDLLALTAMLNKRPRAPRSDVGKTRKKAEG